MTLHIVKHVATGFALPAFKGRGGSFWDPTAETYYDPGTPRIFSSKQAATSFITQWARGEFHTTRTKGDWGFTEPEEYTEVKDVGRKRSDLIAVPVRIIEEN